MTWRLLGLFAVLVSLLVVVTAYVGHRAAELVGLGRRVRTALLCFLGLTALSPFGLRFVALEEPNDAFALARAIALVGFGLGLGSLIAAGFLLPVDGIAWLSRRLSARRRSSSSKRAEATSRASDVPTSPQPPEDGLRTAGREHPCVDRSADDREAETLMTTRRAVLRRTSIAGALAIGGGCSAYGILRGRHDYVIEEVPIPIRGLPLALDGFTIAQISDVHIGAFVGDHELGCAEDLVRRTRADLVVMTGDLVDHDPRYVPRLGAFARRLVDLGVREGVVAVAGNHDYYAGIDAVLDALRAAGVRVLRNEGVIVPDRNRGSSSTPAPGFSLLGTDDVWARRYGYGGGADLPRTLSYAHPDRPRVLLCHNPELFPEAAEHVELMLSGHTHGGQVSVLVRPADWFLRHGYVAGHYHRGTSQIYVNRGFGTAGPPARIATPPEVSRIVLVAA